jgi:hypothetical protein
LDESGKCSAMNEEPSKKKKQVRYNLTELCGWVDEK